MVLPSRRSSRALCIRNRLSQRRGVPPNAGKKNRSRVRTEAPQAFAIAATE